ncbi:DUF397 domain-containing protein [Streptomyces sp. NBC_01218]|uniref:DUF397 domain-containing protein n=1 Tax=Streptomyces sp. NBC_01218 TaxID=2903780 RepID=UPI002E105E3F|nr:DUF397 domain-containing protein [Streptomyces sp. NBC_01218]
MAEHNRSHPASLRHTWRKSSYSGPDNDSCLEVDDAHPSAVPVRDSKSPQEPPILFGAPGWSAFVAAVKDGSLSS